MILSFYSVVWFWIMQNLHVSGNLVSLWLFSILISLVKVTAFLIENKVFFNTLCIFSLLQQCNWTSHTGHAWWCTHCSAFLPFTATALLYSLVAYIYYQERDHPLQRLSVSWKVTSEPPQTLLKKPWCPSSLHQDGGICHCCSCFALNKSLGF